jgi:transposase-like protein
MVRERRVFSKEFKMRLMHELIAGATVAELARRHRIHPRLLYGWYWAYQRDPKKAFDPKPSGRSKIDPQAVQIAELERKLGQVTMENEFLKKVLRRVEATFGPLPRKNGTA